MTSIRKVAKAAGVSVATVSRALSDPEKVSEAALKKVHAAIGEVKYRPNMLARNFRSAKSYSIVVLVPNIANPFFSRVIRGIESVAQGKGYAVLLGDTDNSDKREAEYVRLVETRQADGIIQLSPKLPGNLVIEGEGGLSYPFVNACECVDNAPCPTVRIDNAAAMRTVTDYLIGAGHRRIGVIQGPPGSPLTRDRLAGYHAGLDAAGLSASPNLLVTGDFTMASGQAAARHFATMTERPTAVLCMNDEMAIGLIKGLKEQGLNVPGDMSVTGFDDIEYAKFSDPALTTVSQPAEEIGRTAMSVLFDMLEGRAPGTEPHILQTSFILRDSSKAL